uniref:Cathepsin propeptide inhibitor domain-containing protein n=1 Tax=Oryza glumipatula TaxID=40148 RepID=A0A0E0BVJ5_9ORYZ
MASRLVRAAHGASRVARLAAAAAARRDEEGASSRAASLAASPVARSARAAAASAAASPSSPSPLTTLIASPSATAPTPRCVTEEDLESDEAVWALFERYCKSYKRKYDDAEMVRRFHIFKFNAKTTYCWNNYLHKDVKELARAKKDRDLGLPVDSWYLQKELGEFDDGREYLPLLCPSCIPQHVTGALRQSGREGGSGAAPPRRLPRRPTAVHVVPAVFAAPGAGSWEPPSLLLRRVELRERVDC